MSLDWREPEGMAIHITGSETRLCFGLGSTTSPTNTNKLANIFFKNLLVTGT
jgi:hypothetical protein